MMSIQQYELWLVDLNPQVGTEPGKIRPVVVVQTNLLNTTHPSTRICPITTNIQPGATILRLDLKKGESNVQTDCDIMVDRRRAIDNKRFIRKTGKLSMQKILKLTENIKFFPICDDSIRKYFEESRNPGYFYSVKVRSMRMWSAMIIPKYCSCLISRNDR